MAKHDPPSAPAPAPLADTPAKLARLLRARLDWEWECGALGVGAEKKEEPIQRAPVEPKSSSFMNLEELRHHIGDCQRCGLAATRNALVFGEGAPRAQLMFVGEGPGRDEDISGRPFVGEAGQLLDKIISAMGLRREDVYICNVVKCRPPQNRTPSVEEGAACRHFLFEQIRLVSPRIVVSLGATATSVLLGREGALSGLRGSFYDLGNAQLMPTYHPAYLLRNPGEKRAVWEDMRKVMTALGLALPAKKEAGGQ